MSECAFGNTNSNERLRRTKLQISGPRYAVQIGFLALCILIGMQFVFFVRSLGAPEGEPVWSRPAGVEAFLPISSLMSLVYFIRTGVLNDVHPAGLVLFTLTLVLAIAMRRGFCSWVCPIGTISEWAHKLGARLFGRNVNIPRPIDYPLRALKYALLGFFLYHIVRMPAEGLHMFIHGPYNRIADVKMYYFFANLSTTALLVLGALLALSVVFKNFWCRYLCPYGALLCLGSLASPLAIRRDEATCTGCGRCARACPNRLPVNRKMAVRSPECTACLTCVAACPVAGTLRFAARPKGRPLPAGAYGAVTIAAFIFASQIAGTFDYWESKTPPWLYRRLHTMMAQIDHPRTGGVAGPSATVSSERLEALRRIPGHERLTAPAPSEPSDRSNRPDASDTAG